MASKPYEITAADGSDPFAPSIPVGAMTQATSPSLHDTTLFTHWTRPAARPCAEGNRDVTCRGGGRGGGASVVFRGQQEA